MKADTILLELAAVKDRLAAEAHGNSLCFLDQLEAWLEEHPGAGPVVKSPEELQARLRAREAAEPLPPKGKPYRVDDPIMAEVPRNREKLSREGIIEALVLKDEPPRKNR